MTIHEVLRDHPIWLIGFNSVIPMSPKEPMGITLKINGNTIPYDQLDKFIGEISRNKDYSSIDLRIIWNNE